MAHTDRTALVIIRMRPADFRRFGAEAKRHGLQPTEAARALIFGAPTAVRDHILTAATTALAQARDAGGGDRSPSVRARAIDAGARAAATTAIAPSGDPMAVAEARAADVDARAAQLLAQMERLITELAARRAAAAPAEAAPAAAAPAEAGGAA